jgi:hypothetical protein
MKTSELTGAALDWAVAKCEFPEPDYCPDDWLVYVTCELDNDMGTYTPSTDWAQGGPIIAKEGITLRCGLHGWDAELPEFRILMDGETALIAAMRCYIASKLGNNIDIPEE